MAGGVGSPLRVETKGIRGRSGSGVPLWRLSREESVGVSGLRRPRPGPRGRSPHEKPEELLLVVLLVSRWRPEAFRGLLQPCA